MLSALTVNCNTRLPCLNTILQINFKLKGQNKIKTKEYVVIRKGNKIVSLN